MPYTDFYAYLTPFYYWYSYFILCLGENTIFISRILGQINLNILFLITYKILNINFPKPQSSIASLFSLIFYLSINAILSYDFIHITNIFALLAFYIISTKKNKGLLFLGGFFAALCFLTKQSNGSILFITIFAIFIYRFWKETNIFVYPILGSFLACIINFFPFLFVFKILKVSKTFDILSILAFKFLYFNSFLDEIGGNMGPWFFIKDTS